MPAHDVQATGVPEQIKLTRHAAFRAEPEWVRKLRAEAIADLREAAK